MIYADTPEVCEKVVRMLSDSPVVGVDTETVGHDIKTEHPKGLARAVSIQFATESESVFVPLWPRRPELLQIFKPLLECETPRFVLHNAKYDWHVLRNHGINPSGLLADTMVLDYQYYTAREHGLKACARRYFDAEVADYSETFADPVRKKNGELGKRTEVAGLLQVIATNPQRLIDYAIKDPIYTVKLYQYLEPKLREIEWTSSKSYWDYYTTIERPYTRVLYDMEQRGVRIDHHELCEMQVDLTREIVRAKDNFQRACVGAGLKTPDLNSPKQIGEMLLLMGLRVERTPTGQPKTDVESLCPFSNYPPVAALLHYRKLSKLLNTYVEPFHACFIAYGRIHTSFRQTGTATGRLSSSNPNLQNIPRSSEDEDGYGSRLRSLFIAEPGEKFGAIDLPNAELRLAAHFSGEEALLSAFQQGQDLHSLTAQRTFSDCRDLSLDEIKSTRKARRNAAKTLNFAILYGMGPTAYNKRMGVRDGQQVIDSFFRGYPKLKLWMDKVRSDCRHLGYVRTLFGRYIHIPQAQSSDSATRAYGDRCAVNYVIQGSCADLIKAAMVLLSDEPMTLQVHDELTFSLRASDRIAEVVSTAHERFGFPMQVSMPAELGLGRNWREAK